MRECSPLRRSKGGAKQASDRSYRRRRRHISFGRVVFSNKNYPAKVLLVFTIGSGGFRGVVYSLLLTQSRATMLACLLVARGVRIDSRPALRADA